MFFFVPVSLDLSVQNSRIPDPPTISTKRRADGRTDGRAPHTKSDMDKPSLSPVPRPLLRVAKSFYTTICSLLSDRLCTCVHVSVQMILKCRSSKRRFESSSSPLAPIVSFAATIARAMPIWILSSLNLVIDRTNGEHLGGGGGAAVHRNTRSCRCMAIPKATAIREF